MRKLVYYVACSADGFIAEEDGSFGGFLPDGPHVGDYLESFHQFDTVLMGRKTYDVGLNAGKTNPYPMFDSYVFSRSMKASPDEQVTLVSENAEERVRALKEMPGKPIYLCGGAVLAGDLLRAGLIDGLTLKVNPFLMGKGIPLFSGVISPIQMKLVKSTTYGNGVLLVHYEITTPET
jgi:dihydrofolate reductase